MMRPLSRANFSSVEICTSMRSNCVPSPRSCQRSLITRANSDWYRSNGCVGYDDAAKRVLVRNSWGSGWGQKGYFTMPYDYVADRDLSDDFWTVRS